MLEKVMSRFFIKMKETSDNGVHIDVGNFQGIGKRSQQQDSFFVSDFTDRKLVNDEGVLSVVADGMGGLANGAEVSAMITKITRSFFAENRLPRFTIKEEESTYLLGLLEAIDIEVQKNNISDESGSTMVAVWVRGNQMYFLSVGDSRIYLCRDGELIQLNQEHNLGSILKEELQNGRITQEEFEATPGKSGLTSYIGMSQLALVDTSEEALALQDGDTILLMSDGVFKTLSKEAMVEACNQQSANLIAKTMRTMIEAIDRPNQDNYTGVILRYNE